MKGTTKSQKMDEAFSVNKTTADISCCFAAKEIHNPLGPFRLSLGEGIRSQVRHFALYDPHPPLSLAKGEATRVRGAIRFTRTPIEDRNRTAAPLLAPRFNLP